MTSDFIFRLLISSPNKTEGSMNETYSPWTFDSQRINAKGHKKTDLFILSSFDLLMALT